MVKIDNARIARIWPDFVNFEKRRRTEAPFLLEQVADFGNPKVFDACLGSGATTIGLRLAGIEDIVSNEIDTEFLRIAQEQAQKYAISLTATSYDWRHLPQEYSERFDAVLCLGNSLTLLSEKEDQMQALHNFRRILKSKGKLIIDERNYPALFLADLSGGLYKWSGNILYCGNDKVTAYPVSISEREIIMEYVHKETGKKIQIKLTPFKEKELLKMLQDTGFGEITIFGDYKQSFNSKEIEFITYVCGK